MDGVVYRHLLLRAKVSLTSNQTHTRNRDEATHDQHVNGNLFALVLEVVDIRSRNALRGIG